MGIAGRFARMVVGLGGGIVLLVGLSYLFFPRLVAEQVGLRLRSPGAFSEIRAGFGGMHIGIACLILAGVFAPSVRRSALILLMVFMGGLIGGRLMSILIDGLPARLIWLVLGVEAVLFALSVLAFFTGRSRT